MRVLCLFDVDGTLAETEEVHRRAFNDAFAGMGLDWSWGRSIYKRLLKTAGGKERIRAFDRSRQKAPSKTRATVFSPLRWPACQW